MVICSSSIAQKQQRQHLISMAASMQVQLAAARLCMLLQQPVLLVL
jgi:hypothetical protein